MTAGSKQIVGLWLILACLSGAARPGVAAEPTQGEVTLKVASPEEYRQVLQRHKGKVVLVDFWATWCIPCVKQFPHTVEWHRQYGDKGLVVVSMSMDDPENKDQALQFLKKRSATFTNLLSSLGGDEQAMEAFDIEGGAVPHYKLYGRDGQLIRQFGADPDQPWDHKDIEQAIQQALRK